MSELAGSRPPQSAPEATLEQHLRAMAPKHGWHFEGQYRWHPERRFRADFAVWHPRFIDGKVAPPLEGEEPYLLVEIDGAKKGAPGAHQRVDGIDRDCRRAAEALVLGYQVLRVSSRMVKDGTALQYIEKLMGVSP